MDTTPDRRTRALESLQRRNLNPDLSPAEAAAAWEWDRFVARARALFYARLMFLMLGLLLLALPAWSSYFGLTGPLAVVGYLFMVLYTVANFMVVQHRQAGRVVTYVTLCFDLAISILLIAKPKGDGVLGM